MKDLKDLSAEKIINILKSNRLTKKILQEAEQAEELVKERIKIKQETEKLKKEKAEKLTELKDLVDLRQFEFNEAKEALKKSQKAWSETNSLFMSESYHFDNEILKRESFLMQTAPVNLKEKLSYLRDKHESVRHSQIEIGNDMVNKQFYNKIVNFSNVNEILEKMAGIESEIKKTEFKILNPSTESEV